MSVVPGKGCCRKEQWDKMSHGASRCRALDCACSWCFIYFNLTYHEWWLDINASSGSPLRASSGEAGGWVGGENLGQAPVPPGFFPLCCGQVAFPSRVSSLSGSENHAEPWFRYLDNSPSDQAKFTTHYFLIS